MKNIEKSVIEAYVPYETSLRAVASICGIDHHRVKRILQANSIKIVRGRMGPFTERHRKNISQACIGRVPWSKGKKMPLSAVYANMSAHIRFNVSADWLSAFSDVEKLKFLNLAVSKRVGRFDFTTNQYKAYIEKFYTDYKFNKIYTNWIRYKKNKWLRPTIDHVIPRSKGGTNELSNLQFLTWFENRAKCDMTQDEWESLKANISDYMI